jgi:hypothetical protein
MDAGVWPNCYPRRRRECLIGEAWILDEEKKEDC